MFKNLLIFQMKEDFSISDTDLRSKMAEFAFRKCAATDIKSSGWVSPVKGSEELCYFSNGHMLLTIMTEDKILPSTVVKEEMEAKIEKLQEAQGRKLKKAEKDTIKDEVIQSLLPRAFSKYSTLSIWIDSGKKRVLVEASSFKKAEDALALLRKTLSSLPVSPFTTNSPIEYTLTEWVKSGQPGEGFEVLDEAELKDMMEEGGVLQSKKQDLSSEEIQNHIEAGKQVTKLMLNWKGKGESDDKINFLLSNDGSLKKIKMSDVLKDKNSDIDKDDFAQRFDADFVLFAGEISMLVSDILEAFVGSETEQSEAE